MELEPEASSFTQLVLLSTLDHRESLSLKARKNVVASALISALEIANTLGLETVATPILAGGWRLEQDEAFDAMLNAVHQLPRSASVDTLTIYCLENSERLQGIARSMGW